ncbi:MAG: hypothetical protein ACTHNW_01590 [Mucilaginibacter sp.]
MTEDLLTFKLKNIDLTVIALVYPECHLSDGFKALIKQSVGKGEQRCLIDINFSSDVVITHPEIEGFNQLFTEFEKVKRAIEANKIPQAELEYNSKVEQLGDKITNDIKCKFEEAIYINKRTTAKLKPHVDTLLYICLALYEYYWDTYGTSFNGPVSEHPVSNLLPAGLPSHSRSIQQVHFVSKLLYWHFKKPNAQRDVTIIAGGQMHYTDDSILVDWLIRLIAEHSFPISMDYTGMVLSKLLKHRHSMDANKFLAELEKFTLLKADDLVDCKRKVVCSYCLDMHKIFSHFLNLPINNLIGKRSKIYHNILLAFKMDDFAELHRVHNGSKQRADEAENRLGTLLRPELSKIKCN